MATYRLLFDNRSGRAGVVCVYQPTTNVDTSVAGLEVLAWMVTGANSGVQIEFQWDIAYDAIWLDAGPPKSRQILLTDLATNNAVTMSFNAFGYLFSNVGVGPAGSLDIIEDGSIPATNDTVVGIGMNGAGTVGLGAAPRQRLVLSPIADPSYRITFGPYTFQVGDVVDPATLNPSAAIAYPDGVSAMTATLDSTNRWVVTAGALDASAEIIYRPGQGVVSG